MGRIAAALTAGRELRCALAHSPSPGWPGASHAPPTIQVIRSWEAVGSQWQCGMRLRLPDVQQIQNSPTQPQSRSKGNRLVLEGISMTKPKVLSEPESTELLERLAPDWPLLLQDGAVIDHVLKVINNARRPYTKHEILLYPPLFPPRRVRSRRPLGVRCKTMLARPRLLPSSGPPEYASNQVKRLA
jgi:hypothetical protein